MHRRFAVLALAVPLVGACAGSVPTAAPTLKATPTATALPASTPTAAPVLNQASPTANATPAASSPVVASPSAAALRTCTDVPTWQCGSLDVPLDWAAPTGRTLQIAYSVRTRDDTTQAALGTVVLIVGGPGFSGMDARDNVSIAALRAHYDFVAFDQRGTGAANPVDCQDLQDGVSSQAELRAANAACGAQLGPDADRYGSGDAARDLEAIRAALDLPAIDLLTFSYGAVVAEAYAARYPLRVRGMAIDGGMLVTDPAHRYAWDFGKAAAWLDVIKLMCARDGTCNDTYPDAGGLIQELLIHVRAKPIQAPLSAGGAEVVADEAAVVSLMGSIDPYGNNSTPKPLLAAATSALRRNDPQALLALVHGAEIPSTDSTPPSIFSAGVNSAAYCNDQDFVWDRTDSVSVREGKLSAAIAALPSDAFAPASNAAWLKNLWPDACIEWPAPNRYEPVIPPGTAYPDVPVLAISGDIDGIVPSSTTRLVAQAYPHGIFASIRNRGHEASIWPDGSCAQVLIAGFFQNLTADPHACE